MKLLTYTILEIILKVQLLPINMAGTEQLDKENASFLFSQWLAFGDILLDILRELEGKPKKAAKTQTSLLQILLVVW